MRKKAFTLIEILIVISIIAIVAAILFPVFGRARENARRAACMNNLKTIGLALMQYVQDYDERYPRSSRDRAIYNFNDAGTTTTSAHRNLFPYVKTLDAYTCPSAAKSLTSGEAATATSSTSYFMNAVMLDNPASSTDWWLTVLPSDSAGTGGKSLAVIPSPAEIIYMQEFGYRDNRAINRPSAWPGTGSPVYNRFAGWCYYNTSDGSYGYSNMHFGGGNLLFADGHVKWRNYKNIRAKEFGLATDAAGTPVPSNDTPSPSCYGGANVVHRAFF